MREQPGGECGGILRQKHLEQNRHQGALFSKTMEESLIFSQFKGMCKLLDGSRFIAACIADLDKLYLALGLKFTMRFPA